MRIRRRNNEMLSRESYQKVVRFSFLKFENTLRFPFFLRILFTKQRIRSMWECAVRLPSSYYHVAKYPRILQIKNYIWSKTSCVDDVKFSVCPTFCLDRTAKLKIKSALTYLKTHTNRWRHIIFNIFKNLLRFWYLFLHMWNHHTIHHREIERLVYSFSV